MPACWTTGGSANDVCNPLSCNYVRDTVGVPFWRRVHGRGARQQQYIMMDGRNGNSVRREETIDRSAGSNAGTMRAGHPGAAPPPVCLPAMPPASAYYYTSMDVVRGQTSVLFVLIGLAVYAYTVFRHVHMRIVRVRSFAVNNARVRLTVTDDSVQMTRFGPETSIICRMELTMCARFTDRPNFSYFAEKRIRSKTPNPAKLTDTLTLSKTY